MHENLDYIENHFIVLGYGDVGRQIVQYLKQAGVLFVVIDSDETVFQDADFPYVVGDATHESILKKVGIKYASTVIISMEDDSNIITNTKKATDLCVSIAEKKRKKPNNYSINITI